MVIIKYYLLTKSEVIICMEYVSKCSLGMVQCIGIFQRATQRPRILLTDNIQSGGSCGVNVLLQCSTVVIINPLDPPVTKINFFPNNNQLKEKLIRINKVIITGKML